jgi:hypothetical protein
VSKDNLKPVREQGGKFVFVAWVTPGRRSNGSAIVQGTVQPTRHPSSFLVGCRERSFLLCRSVQDIPALDAARELEIVAAEGENLDARLRKSIFLQYTVREMIPFKVFKESKADDQFLRHKGKAAYVLLYISPLSFHLLDICSLIFLSLFLCLQFFPL